MRLPIGPDQKLAADRTDPKKNMPAEQGIEKVILFIGAREGFRTDSKRNLRMKKAHEKGFKKGKSSAGTHADEDESL